MNPFDLVKNAKDLQNQLSKLQIEIENIEVEGSSGGGLVRLTLNGKFNMVTLQLDPIVVDNRDIPMLQDLIRSAHTDAVEKMKEVLKTKLGPLAALSGGLPL
ncbi:MAG: YbaB/EbfC family nucleoid-associated protein [Treponema sp.]